MGRLQRQLARSSPLARSAALLLVCIGVASRAASAADAPPTGLVEQKMMFVGRLLADSSALKRIETSGSAKAAGELADGGAQYERARAAMAAGDTAAANTALDRAIAAIGRARHLAPDEGARSGSERARFGQLLQSTETLLASYTRNRERLGARASADLAPITALVDRAKGLAAAGRQSEANAVLAEAEERLLEAINRLLGSETLLYTATFASPIEQFDHELRRYQSLVDLVPQAVTAFNPDREARVLVDRYVESGRTRHDAALAKVTATEYAVGVALMRDAIEEIQRALVAAGLPLLR